VFFFSKISTYISKSLGFRAYPIHQTFTFYNLS